MKQTVSIPKFIIFFILASLLTSYWAIKILNIQNGELLYTPGISELKYETYFGTTIVKDFGTFEDVEGIIYDGKKKNEIESKFSDLAVISDYDKFLIFSFIIFIILFVLFKFRFKLKD